MRPPISVTLICCNEAQKIGCALQSVQSWAQEIIVVDSGSQDQTCEIAKSFGAKVLVRAWNGYGDQKNFAQSQAKHDWVLNLDADEWLSQALKDEIDQNLSQWAQEYSGIAFARKTYYLGRWIRHGGWYPNRLVRLSFKHRSNWSTPEVHESLQVQGAIGRAKYAIEHYAFSTMQEHLQTNFNFAQLGAKALIAQGKKTSFLKVFFKPWVKFIETYFFKMGFLDGLSGFLIAVHASYSIFLKYSLPLEPLLKKQEELEKP